MSRGLTSAMQTAIAAGNVYPVLFGWFDFTGGAVRVCSHNQSVSWDAQTWTGLGDLVRVEPVRESREVRAQSLSFVLAGISSTLIGEVLANRSRGRECALWFGAFNSAGVLLADPVKIFSGRMDQPTIEDTGDTCTVTIAAESRLVDLQRSRERRYTDADQQNLYSGDLGLQYVAGLQNREIVWGQGSSSSGQGGVPVAAPSAKPTEMNGGLQP